MTSLHDFSICKFAAGSRAFVWGQVLGNCGPISLTLLDYIYGYMIYLCIIRLYSNKNNNNSNNNIRIYNIYIYIYIHMFDEILLHMTQAALSSGWPLFGLSHSCSSLSPHSIRAFHVQQPRLVILQEGLFKLGRLAAHQSLLGPGGGWRWMKSAKKRFVLPGGIVLCGIGAAWLRFARTESRPKLDTFCLDWSLECGSRKRFLCVQHCRTGLKQMLARNFWSWAQSLMVCMRWKKIW